MIFWPRGCQAIDYTVCRLKILTESQTQNPTHGKGMGHFEEQMQGRGGGGSLLNTYFRDEAHSSREKTAGTCNSRPGAETSGKGTGSHSKLFGFERGAGPLARCYAAVGIVKRRVPHPTATLVCIHCLHTVCVLFVGDRVFVVGTLQITSLC